MDKSSRGYHKKVGELPEASDHEKAIITREQYEAALSAKNNGWIEWGGGACPVEEGTLVDVKYRDGDDFPDALGVPALSDCGTGSAFWELDGYNNDIIAYRLHQPQEATESDGEADLNDCIGQDAAPVWSGEGLPPVGCECEVYTKDSFADFQWVKIKVAYVHNGEVIGIVDMPGTSIHDSIEKLSEGYCLAKFRPIRSEADRKRDAAVEAIDRYMPEFIQDTPNDYYNAKKIYDAIAAGKIPGVKLED